MGIRLSQEEATKNVQEKCLKLNYTFRNFKYKTSSTTLLFLTCSDGHNWNSTTYKSFISTDTACPHCKTKNQTFTYINVISDGDEDIALKYGKERKMGTRAIQQERKSIFSIRRHKTYLFLDTVDCNAAEMECILLFQLENHKLYNRKGYLLEEQMLDGFSETTIMSNMSRIIEIYEKHNGIEVIDKPPDKST